MNLKMNKKAWAEIGNKMGWIKDEAPKQVETKESLGWTLEKRAQEAEAFQQAKKLRGSCEVCGATWEADPNETKCPNCGAPSSSLTIA